MFELLAKQYEAARLDEARTAAVIQVVDPAIEPDSKSGPPRAWIFALITMSGLLAGAGYAVSSEMMLRIRLNPNLCERWTNLAAAVVHADAKPQHGA
jgi:uncharacterized protein involved in exopolysaccharide biosynthesis